MIEEVKITLDRERTLVYDFNAQCAFENATRSVHLCPGCEGAKIIKDPDNPKEKIGCSVCISRGFVDVYVNTLIENVWSRINAHNIKALLWACLLREDPDLKISDVGNMINLKNYLDIHNALKQAIENAMPEQETGENKKKAKKIRPG